MKEKLTNEIDDAIITFLPVKNQMLLAQTCKSFRDEVKEMYREPVLKMIENLNLDYMTIKKNKMLYKEMETFAKAMFNSIQYSFHLKCQDKDDLFKDEFFSFLTTEKGNFHKDSHNLKQKFIAEDGDTRKFIENIILVFTQINESFKNLDLPNLTLLLLKLTNENIRVSKKKEVLSKGLLQKTLRNPEKYGQVMKFLVHFYGILRKHLVRNLKNKFSFSSKDCEELVKYQSKSYDKIIFVYSLQFSLVSVISIVTAVIISSMYKFEIDEILSKPQYLIPIFILITIQYQYVLFKRFNDFYEVKND